MLHPNAGLEEFSKSKQDLVIDDLLTSGDCDDDSEGGEGDGDSEEAHDALKARLLYEGFNLKVIVYFCSKMHKF